MQGDCTTRWQSNLAVTTAEQATKLSWQRIVLHCFTLLLTPTLPQTTRLLDRKLLDRGLRLSIVLDGSAPLLHRRVGRQIDFTKSSDPDPGPESKVGNSGSVQSNEARTSLLLLLQLILEHLVETCGFTLESGEGRLLRFLAVCFLPIVV